MLKRISTKFGEAPVCLRQFNHLSLQSRKSLSDYINKVQHFIELTNQNMGTGIDLGDVPKVLELKIESLALKKQLAKELFDMYKD